VTLGLREQDDLEQLITILTKDYKATQICLWGRSMGAVTSIFYAKRNSMFITCMILDSPFSDIEIMVDDFAKQKINSLFGITSVIVKIAMNYTK